MILKRVMMVLGLLLMSMPVFGQGPLIDRELFFGCSPVSVAVMTIERVE
jgi:hypothetical protein